ncbi:MAG: choice-of-anchor D domain-containing protein [Candidatus Cloacimonetes bacterium]|nr:choice-of-anchor D domain-containing protein [Candidatus Cloacimonadota bacterium]
MRMKILLLLIILTIALSLTAQNIMQIPNSSAGASEILTISLNIENSDNFSAFQTDIILPSSAAYVTASAILTERSNGHSLSASLLANNTLRIFAYSLSNAFFDGNSGAVLEFQVETGTVPGNFNVNLQNSIIADQTSANILTQSISGVMTIIAPNISVSSNLLNFGEIPLNQNQQLNLTIYNTGNHVLSVSNLETDNQYFIINGNSLFYINPSTQQTVTVQFNSVEKGTYQNNLTIFSDDPDQPELIISLKAIAFAVNELHMQPCSGISGSIFSIPFAIENMEQFTAFQFDLQMPQQLSYEIIETTLSERANGHVSTAQSINSNLIRVVAYSLDNSFFFGNSGIVSYLNIKIDGLGGNYTINPQNVIIGDDDGENIVSASYGAILNIASPSINTVSSVNFGEVSVTETGTANLTINNNGNANLVVSNITFAHASFQTTISLPFSVNPGSNSIVPISFQNSNVGNFNCLMRVFSNDPDDSVVNINLTASTYSPNYLSVENSAAYAGSSVTLMVEADNHDPFVAFQFDLNFPEELSYVQDSAQLTERANGHQLIATLLDENTLRFISYSPNQTPFSGNEGGIVSAEFIVDSEASGELAVQIDNAVLANAQSANILRGTNDGFVEILSILPPPTNLTIQQDGNVISLNWTSVAGANSYWIMVSDDPSAPLAQWQKIDTVDTNSYSEEPMGRRFYRIIASTDQAPEIR